MTPGLALYLVILPRVYGFSSLGHVLDLVVFAIPFVLSVSLLAQLVSLWFRRRETAVLIFMATSLPQFFLVGVSWPRELIPAPLQALSRLVPTTSAMDGLVRINQMGATLQDVRFDWLILWALTIGYGALAILFAGSNARAEIAHEH
ncbi:ABC transporter permease [Tardiphaga alba]|uniref:ABC transporter permease n=1 Tax=Tardiphaga alba TaxID=340268 RepID=UPI00211176D6|nr:ABC transporter permease [Tardiphaga alba]